MRRLRRLLSGSLTRGAGAAPSDGDQETTPTEIPAQLPTEPRKSSQRALSVRK